MLVFYILAVSMPFLFCRGRSERGRIKGGSFEGGERFGWFLWRAFPILPVEISPTQKCVASQSTEEKPKDAQWESRKWGRKSFRQAGLTNGNALVHGYWFAPIGWPVDYDIDTVQRGVYRWFKIQTKSWGWNDPGDWVGWSKLVCQAFSSRSSPASPTSPTSPTSPKADPGQWCSIPSLQWVILVPGATKRWLICSTRHLRSWS